jgi:hypothetical protein
VARTYVSTVLPIAADRVWEVVRDFNGLPEWHPAIERSEIEGGGAADSVGSVRRLQLSGGGVVRERLVALDDAQRSYTYDILESGFAVRSYRATIRVAPVTDSGHSFVEWYADYDAEAADEADLERTFAEGVYLPGLNGLREHLGG